MDPDATHYAALGECLSNDAAAPGRRDTVMETCCMIGRNYPLQIGGLLCGLMLAGVAFQVAATPATPVLVSPSSNGVSVGLSQLLKVSVSDQGNTNLAVKFYGRLAPPGADFTIVALPDTQYYVSNKRGGIPQMLYAQLDWVRNNALARNIAFVAQLGDCVESGDNNTGSSNLGQWMNATNGLYRLEPPLGLTFPDGIGYGVAVGNHDQSPNGDPNGTTSFYNQFLGVPHFAGRDYYGGHYDTNNDNHFDLFSASGFDFIMVFLEYDPTANPAVLAWANGVLQAYPDRRAIVVSHYIGRPTTPSAFGAQGAAIYNALKANPNLFLMLSGHVDGEGSREDVYNGHKVYTLVSDYQFRLNGGNGYLRIMDFSPSNGVIRVSTYSPWLDEYETDADSEFTLPYVMQPAVTNFNLIQSNAGIPSGATVNCNWANLKPNNSYEWYVTVNDGTNTVTSPTWRFTAVASNTPPQHSHFYDLNLRANSSTNISFSVSDRETDSSNLVVTVSSSNNKLVPASGMSLGGSGTNRSLQITPAADETGVAWVTVVVHDGVYSTSDFFQLKVVRNQIITLWNFNSNPPDDNTSTGTLLPTIGTGTASSVGTATNSLNSNVSPVSSDPELMDNSKWRFGNFPAQGTANKTSGAQFRASTAGFQDIALAWDHYNSATGSRYWRLQYTLDGVNYADSSLVYTNPVEVTWATTGVSLAGIPGADNNPNFGFRIVSEWESTATGQGLSQYRGTQASGGYSTVGTLWLDMVTVSGDLFGTLAPTSLKAFLVGSTIRISWPTNSLGYTLQEATDLSAQDWFDVEQPPIIVGGEYVVTASIIPASSFFRLRP